jgi:hypothetical protein
MIVFANQRKALGDCSNSRRFFGQVSIIGEVGATHHPGCNHGHGYGVKELVIVQPAELLDDYLLQERKDRQAAAEYEGASFGEEQKNLHEHVARS